MQMSGPRRLLTRVPDWERLSGLTMRTAPAGGETAGRRTPRLSIRRFVAVLVAVFALLMTSGCGLGSTLPNPFAAEQPTPAPPTPTSPTPVPPAIPPTSVPPVPQPTPSFTPFWVKNHRLTEMWSGPTDGPGVVSFGMTSQQFCSFQVALQPSGPRLYVFNPHSQNYFWINADAVGPVGPPERRAGPAPVDQNCAEIVYSG